MAGLLEFFKTSDAEARARSLEPEEYWRARCEYYEISFQTFHRVALLFNVDRDKFNEQYEKFWKDRGGYAPKKAHKRYMRFVNQFREGRNAEARIHKGQGAEEGECEEPRPEQSEGRPSLEEQDGHESVKH